MPAKLKDTELKTYEKRKATETNTVTSGRDQERKSKKV
jgi:hypothetical protein